MINTKIITILALILISCSHLSARAYALFSANGKYVAELFPNYTKEFTGGVGVVYSVDSNQLGEKLWTFDWYGRRGHVTLLNSGRSIIMVDSMTSGQVIISTPDTTQNYSFKELCRNKRKFDYQLCGEVTRGRLLFYMENDRFWLAAKSDKLNGFNSDSTELSLTLADGTYLKFNTGTGELIEHSFDNSSLTHREVQRDSLDSLDNIDNKWRAFKKSDIYKELDTIVAMDSLQLHKSPNGKYSLIGALASREFPQLDLYSHYRSIPNYQTEFLTPDSLNRFIHYYQKLITTRDIFNYSNSDSFAVSIPYTKDNWGRDTLYINSDWNKIFQRKSDTILTYEHNRRDGITLYKTEKTNEGNAWKTERYFVDSLGIKDTNISIYNVPRVLYPDITTIGDGFIKFESEYKNINLPSDKKSLEDIAEFLGKPDSVIVRYTSNPRRQYWYYLKGYVSVVEFYDNILVKSLGKIREKYFLKEE